MLFLTLSIFLVFLAVITWIGDSTDCGCCGDDCCPLDNILKFVLTDNFCGAFETTITYNSGEDAWLGTIVYECSVSSGGEDVCEERTALIRMVCDPGGPIYRLESSCDSGVTWSVWDDVGTQVCDPTDFNFQSSTDVDVECNCVIGIRTVKISQVP